MADACQTMLRDSKALREFAEQKPEAAKGIIRWLADWFKKIKAAFSRSAQLSEQARFMDRLEKDVREAFGKLWDDALREAVRVHDEIGNMESPATDGGEQNLDREYKQNVDAVLANTYTSDNHINMGSTPTRLSRILGLPKIPMMITKNHVYSVAVSEAKARADRRYRSNTRYHDLGGDIVKDFPELANKPVAIIKSNTDANDARFVVVTQAVDKNGDPVMIAFEPNGRAQYFNMFVPENAVLSGYGKHNFQNYLTTAHNEGRILYAYKNSQQNTNGQGFQLPNVILSTDYTNNLSQFKQIVNQKFAGTMFRNNSGDKYTQFSDRDYLSAVESGDMETAQRMVDEAAKSAGYTIKAYHGTSADFMVFDKDKRGSNYGYEENWFFFTDSTEEAKAAADDAKSNIGGNAKVIAAYLKMQNPLIVQAKKQNLYNPSGSPINYYDQHQQEIDSEAYFGNNDGIMVNGADGTTLYMVTDSEQIKSADPVTYDDQGNVIPLSERFNQENEDIRYSERDYSTPSDLELMEQAAEGLTEAGSAAYWESLLQSAPDLAGDKVELAERARDYKAQAKKLEKITAELAEAKRNLTLTNRKLNTKGIFPMVQSIMKDMAAGDVKGLKVNKNVEKILIDAYQKALDQIDEGADAGTAWETVYNEGVAKAVDYMMENATVSEKIGYKWEVSTMEKRYGAEGRQYLLDLMTGKVAEDFAANRYRAAIQETEADRLVERTEKQMQKKVDAQKARVSELKAQNEALTDQKERLENDLQIWWDSHRKASEQVTFLNERLQETRKELRESNKLSAKERKAKHEQAKRYAGPRRPGLHPADLYPRNEPHSGKGCGDRRQRPRKQALKNRSLP